MTLVSGESSDRETESFVSRFLHSEAAPPSRWRRLVQDMADLFFPERCLLCGSLQALPAKGICTDCLELFEPVLPPYCTRCGDPIPAGAEKRTASSGDTELHCLHCRQGQSPEPVVVTRSLFVYLGPAHRLTLRAKGGDENAAWLMALLLEHAMGSPFERNEGPDWVVPVPQTRLRYGQRGFGVTDVLGRRMAHRLACSFQPSVLQRRHGGRNQVGLKRDERLQNPWDQYRLKGSANPEGKRILLVDDVRTTGATLSACAKCLLDGGAKAVRGLTFARSE